MRIIAAALALLACVTTAHAAPLVLGDRTGGYVALHLAQARQWLANRRTVVIAGRQMSAAAIQVVWYKAKGGRICARPGAKLWFHMGTDTLTGRRTDTAGRVLHMTIREGWYSPQRFGIPTCKRV